MSLRVNERLLDEPKNNKFVEEGDVNSERARYGAAWEIWKIHEIERRVERGRRACSSSVLLNYSGSMRREENV